MKRPWRKRGPGYYRMVSDLRPVLKHRGVLVPLRRAGRIAGGGPGAESVGAEPSHIADPERG